jgi:hypothetical protein
MAYISPIFMKLAPDQQFFLNNSYTDYYEIRRKYVT